tara:strand:- start:1561 stop:2163 length:603 start_codon:yes stop_codon:yes gene_type:complete
MTPAEEKFITGHRGSDSLKTMLAIKAAFFATIAHAATGQQRKYTGLPYITHPIAVAKTIALNGGHPEMVAAAYLHDVIEDTQVTPRLLRQHFPRTVVDLVVEVTDTSTPADGDRGARKAVDRAHLAAAGAAAQTLKLADIIDNLSTIAEHDINFARTYFAEKALVLDVLTKGDPHLWLRAKEMIRTFEAAQSHQTAQARP